MATPKKAEAFEISEGKPVSASRRLPPLRLSKDEKPKVSAEELEAKQKAAEERRLAALQKRAERTPDRPSSRQSERTERTPNRPSSRQGSEDIQKKLEDDLSGAEQRRQEKLQQQREKLKSREEHAAGVRSRAARHKQALADASTMEVGGEQDNVHESENAASSDDDEKLNTWDVAGDAPDDCGAEAAAHDDATLF